MLHYGLQSFTRMTCPVTLRLLTFENDFEPKMTKMTIRAMKSLCRDTRGSVFVEAALVLPLTVIILAGIMEWGLTLYQYNQLSAATANAVRELIISRGYSTPYKNVTDQFAAWARTLEFGTGKRGTIIVTVNGTTCSKDADCKTALDGALGKNATVTAKYDCYLQFTPTAASPCPIVISMTGLVE